MLRARWTTLLAAARATLRRLGIRTRRLNPTERLGRCGERAARRHLHALGYRTLGANLRVPMGEADLVCVAPCRRRVVLVEVKARRLGAVITPEQRTAEAAVNEAKRTTLRHILIHLARHNRWKKSATRIDIVAVDFDAQDRVIEVRHHIDAVR
ncbi:YraN family protein [soil metagenome]